MAAWLNRLLERHPQYDSDGVLDLRAQFLKGCGDASAASVAGDAGVLITEREEATRVLFELRQSYFEHGAEETADALERLDLAKLPDLRSSAERLILDERLRGCYLDVAADSSVDTELRRLLVDNVVLSWRERRRQLADFLTVRQLGAKASPAQRRRARKGAKRVSKHYPELEVLHGWWLRDVARLPGWNPLRSLFRAIRGWLLHFVALFALMLTMVFLFAGSLISHQVFLQLFQLFHGTAS